MLHAALRAAEAAWRDAAPRAARATDLRAAAAAAFASEPLVRDVEYVSVADRETMAELDVVDDGGAVVSVAARIGDVRLIDNLPLVN